ncbi:MAG: peptidylprolyl isomerase [Methylococcales bacterium]|nr:peptidylprolyl isomerase [Methylococcales bacterium]
MKITFFIFLLSSLLSTQAFADKVLVTIGKSGQVTEQQLESAMQAAPFATQFPAMDEKGQAYLRGDMLLRMARAEALYQEAVELGKNKSVVFNKEMGNYKTSLLAQRYVNNLRQQIKISKEIDQQLTIKYKDNNDALVAARSVVVAKQFTNVKKKSINQLKQQAEIETYFNRLNKSPSSNTVLAEGNDLLIKYGDLLPSEKKQAIDKQHIIDKVNEWVVLLLTAKEAEKKGENVDSQLQEFGQNLTTRLLLVEKEKQWISDENTLLDYFQKHPEIGYIPERRQIGQIVLSTEQEAKGIQARIKAGESLFMLAGQFSVDPYGKQRSGDMGWLTEGEASQEIEAGIKNLKDNHVSEIIKTDKGWHLIVIINRKPSEQKTYTDIKDRVRQKFLAEKMTTYLKDVVAKHPLEWKIANHI